MLVVKFEQADKYQVIIAWRYEHDQRSGKNCSGYLQNKSGRR